jgi:hypothetical protein
VVIGRKREMESARGKNKRRKECLVADNLSMDGKSRRLAISYSKAMMRDERKLRLVLRYFDLFDRGRYGRISVANDSIPRAGLFGTLLACQDFEVLARLPPKKVY